MKRIIKVKVVTRAHHENVEETGIDEYKMWVTAVPESGKANQAVIDLLAEYFNIAPSTIRIISGNKSTHKLIEIR